MNFKKLKNIAIIPARGGSKRIPRKNIRNFLGKPIMAYSIEAAIKSEPFEEVMVSTDDREIGEIDKKYGAKVDSLRSAVSANDYATTFDVIKEVINEYSKKNEVFEHTCCIYPTAPFASSSVLKEFFRFLKKTEFDCVFPVLRYGYPIQRALKIKENGKMEIIDREYLNTRSQDLETTYHDAGQFYWFRINKILKKGNMWSDNTGVKVIDEMRAQDIDNEEDCKIAEFKYNFLEKILLPYE